MRFAERVAATVDRMSQSEGCRWHRELAPAAATVERGSFYVGGPVCLIARAADGRYLGSVVEADAVAMAGHPNSRPVR